VAVLENALDRCMTEDVCTGEVSAALEYLGTQATLKWPFDQFRRALVEPTRKEIEKEAQAANTECITEWDQASVTATLNER